MTGYFNFYHSNARLSLWGIDVTVADPGEGPGEPAPLFLDQTEARRPEKKKPFGDRPSRANLRLDDRGPPPP